MTVSDRQLMVTAGDGCGRTPPRARDWRAVGLLCAAWAVVLCGAAPRVSDRGNRLRDLESTDPYYVHLGSPRLVTPQWVGEAGVEAVAVLAIDDMRGHAKWEAYLRPILERLKQIDGRAPISIMTCQIDPAEPHLQRWLREGVHLDAHTWDHPCPLLQGGDFGAAVGTYQRCVDVLFQVPGNQPVAFRTPCCDSRNSVSPRFFAEIFSRPTPSGHFLRLDSSVMMRFTSDDPQLPRELVLDGDGTERFARYLPGEGFVNTIENYPYPYVVGRLAWELPCVVPSDWSAQNLLKPANPRTVADLGRALDAAVVKQGVFDLVFHPYDWLRNDQIVELVDQAVGRHGTKLKFLQFAEVEAQLTKHLTLGEPLRAADGSDNGVRLVDLDDDGYLDVVVGNDRVRRTRRWLPQERRWQEGEFPLSLVSHGAEGPRSDIGARWGVFLKDGYATVAVADDARRTAWTWSATGWQEDPQFWQGAERDGEPVLTARGGRDAGVRFADLDRDGVCELIAAGPQMSGVWRKRASGWERLPWDIPDGARWVDSAGQDRGMRLVDMNDDLYLDLLYSHEQGYGLFLYEPAPGGWSRAVSTGQRGDARAVGMIVRGGTHNGAWFRPGELVLQNEDTARQPDLVERQRFSDLLAEVPPAPRESSAAEATLGPRAGFVAQCVAAEPLVQDPVGFDWDEQGRMWVVEMGDYPQGEDGAPAGRIRCLTDRDGDGRYDASVLFQEGLRYPNSLATWRDGVLVFEGSDLVFLADRDGDGRCDVREVLFTGFSEGNPQHRTNGLARGLDGWFHCAAGAGTIRSLKTGQEVELHGRDFRVRPDTGELEPLLGHTQFLRQPDDWGHWFGNSNIEPLYQFVLEDRYLARNPHVAPPDGVVLVPENPGTARVYPQSRTLERFNDFHTANRFTSACGSTIYRDELFPPAYHGNAFVSEPVHNLVHREVLRREGAEFHGRRAADEHASEFLASSDHWFRPTQLATGPDGALWVADMYRAVIEHPEWIPSEQQARLDLRGGSDRGRIWRVFPVGASPRGFPQLAGRTTPELAAQLDHASGWVRDKVQFLLLERGDRSAAEVLKRLLSTPQVRAATRLKALATLDLLGALDEATLVAALADPHPQVQRYAVRSAEKRLDESSALRAAVIRLAGHTDEDVVLQLALSLGESTALEVAAALARLLRERGDSRWIVAGVMSSAVPHLAALVEHLFAGETGAVLSTEIVGPLLDTALGAADRVALERLLVATTRSQAGEFHPQQVAWLGRLIEGLERRGLELEKPLAGAALPAEQLAALRALLAYARQLAGDVATPLEMRVPAIALLARDASTREADLTLLCDLLGGQHSPELRQAALASLGRLTDDDVGGRLLAGWKNYPPDVRQACLASLFSRDAWVVACLDSLEQGLMSPQDLDAFRRQRLLGHRLREVRTRAEAILGRSDGASRAEVVAQFADLNSDLGDAARGAALFERKCAVCHRLGDRGHAVGPDLSALTDRSAGALLTAIFDPNRAVESRYVSYSAATTTGLVFQGVLTAETSTSVTLLAQEGQRHMLLRSELEQLESSGKSLMPEGMERDFSRAELADLLRFLGESQRPTRSMPGNRPALVVADALRREFSCLPANAEIYGDTLTLEAENGNLGYWGSANDHAIWSLEVTHGGWYDVLLEYACEDGVAGNEFVLEIGDQRLIVPVSGTESWSNYRRMRVGQLRLTPGRGRLGMRSSGPIQGYLLDLKSITLRPARLE